MQRVRLLELIADSLEPGAAEAFDKAHAKASPPMPPASVDEEVPPDEPKLGASDEPKLEASGDDACRVRRTPSLLLSRLRTMVAMISGGMELTGAGMVLLGMSPLGMLQVAMVSGIGPKTIHSQPLLQWTRQVRTLPARAED